MSSSLASQFKLLPSKTIQLELSGGGAHGAYEWGALEILLPFWLERGFKVKIVTGVSAGAVNAALLTAAINSGRSLQEVMGTFWEKLGKKGDAFLAPFLEWHSLTSKFNIFASPQDAFPNIPRHLIESAKWFGKSAQPLIDLRNLLNECIGENGWDHVRNGDAQAVVATLRIRPDGQRETVFYTKETLSAGNIVKSAALRDFAPYVENGEVFEDYGYKQIGFHMPDAQTDVLFAIGLKPLKNISEIEDHRGIKTGQLHHDLARYYMDPARTSHIDFICMDPPSYWNETSAMNNTSENINKLRLMGREAAQSWIADNGQDFGKTSSFRPTPELLKFVTPERAPVAA